MAKPKMIGTVNGYSISQAKFGRKNFVFDGTTLGLVRAAVALGAKAGDTIKANYGRGFRSMVIYYNSMDDRCENLWAR